MMENKETLIWNLYAAYDDASDKLSAAHKEVRKWDTEVFELSEKLKQHGYDPDDYPFDDEDKLIK